MDDHVQGGRGGSEAQPLDPHITLHQTGERNQPPVIAAHFVAAVDQRPYPVPARRSSRAHLAADQPGRASDEDAQQQAASLFPGLASDWPKGTAVPQPGNTP